MSEAAARSQTATLASLFISVFTALLGLGIVIPLLPVYADDMGASGLMIGLMVAGFSISRGVLQPFVGSLSDRQGRKRFMMVGLTIYTMVGLSFPLATVVEHLIIIRVVHGVGSAMIVPIAMSYVAGFAPQGQEGRYMGMLNVALFSGIGFGPVIGGVFRDNFGFNSAFYAMTAASVVSLLMVTVLLPADRPEERRFDVPPILSTMRKMAGDVRVMGILLGRMSTMFVMVPLMAFLPLHMERFMSASGTQIGVVIAARTLTNAVLQFPFGGLVDRTSKVSLLVIGSLIVAAATCTIPFLESFPALIAMFMVIGTGEALIWPTLGALATEEGRAYGHGSMMGVFNTAMSGGILLGSLTGGIAADVIGLKAVFPVIAGTLTVATAASALMLTSRSRARTPAPIPAP
ncbi:MAG TPA: MFS transporter [Dehalococcoidia bacterium]|nr:MFS transporter [Dehalococcoidia bacterium]